jgi:hypothetical protein
MWITDLPEDEVVLVNVERNEGERVLAGDGLATGR